MVCVKAAEKLFRFPKNLFFFPCLNVLDVEVTRVIKLRGYLASGVHVDAQ